MYCVLSCNGAAIRWCCRVIVLSCNAAAMRWCCHMMVLPCNSVRCKRYLTEDNICAEPLLSQLLNLACAFEYYFDVPHLYSDVSVLPILTYKLRSSSSVTNKRRKFRIFHLRLTLKYVQNVFLNEDCNYLYEGIFTDWVWYGRKCLCFDRSYEFSSRRLVFDRKNAISWVTLIYIYILSLFYLIWFCKF